MFTRSALNYAVVYLQEGGHKTTGVGVQAPARDRTPHATLSWRAADAPPRVPSGWARIRHRALRWTRRIRFAADRVF